MRVEAHCSDTVCVSVIVLVQQFIVVRFDHAPAYVRQLKFVPSLSFVDHNVVILFLACWIVYARIAVSLWMFAPFTDCRIRTVAKDAMSYHFGRYIVQRRMGW